MSSISPFPALVLAAGSVLAASASAFPPYRSTDADVAAPGVLEGRCGFFRVERNHGESHYSSPLLRVNLGIGHQLELISELEHRPEDDQLGDGALGVKWAHVGEPWGFGVETLTLLPVSADHSGAGVESRLLATLRRSPFRLHMNAGGFYDSRLRQAERGWRASLLGEWEEGRVRLGVEVFAKQTDGAGVQAQLGPGMILSVGSLLDVRAAIHAGVTSQAPDLTASLWVSSKWSLW
jgi:hypothetical protein